MSLSARRAWIEKTLQCPVPKSLCVALRKESVDRKGRASKPPTVSQVALRKESVDRKIFGFGFFICQCGSLSARRAWIENVDPDSDTLTDDGRSPQGERG